MGGITLAQFDRSQFAAIVPCRATHVVPRRTRPLGLGLLIHIRIDAIDCLMLR